jgi:hypothetical protein
MNLEPLYLCVWNFAKLFLILQCLFISRILTQPADINEPGQPPMQKFSFETPEHTEEQEASQFMPEDLTCDGCEVVAYKIFEAFQVFNSKHPHYKNQLPESEVISIFDEICLENADKTFGNYGMKQVNGKAVLSGPGLKTAELAGVVAGGGKWPSRLGKMCEFFRGELDDIRIYNAYKEHPRNRKGLTKFLCKGKGVQGSCNFKDKTKHFEL